jgi:peptidyl-tRNA hydrolase, PTH1 family
VYLVVGLGNPGREYEHSRHNLGFAVVELLAQRHRLGVFRRSRHRALVAKGVIASSDVLLAKPTTFMNLSGDATRSLTNFYRLAVSQVVVIHDELDFTPGQVRIKVGGGDGGHNGLRSIIEHLGNDFIRVRIGIGKPASAARGAEHVLSGFAAAEQKLIDDAVGVAADAVEEVLAKGAVAAMNAFNRRHPSVDDLEEDEK